MSGAEDDTGDKSFEASRRKLETAREKGDIPRSPEFIGFIAVATLLVSLLAFGVLRIAVIQDALRGILWSAAQFETSAIIGNSRTILYHLAGTVIAPVLVIGMALVAARQIIFTATNLQPKLNRISPIQMSRKLFGPQALLEYLRKVTKVGVLLLILAWLTMDGRFFDPVMLEQSVASVAGRHLEGHLSWLRIVLIVFLAFAVLDLFVKHFEFAKKQRMSHKELRDEHKNEEGDEAIRQNRRQRAEEIATNRMLLDVPKAAVVITNPTHFAVALKWNGDPHEVPICVAKGTNETARRIREVAIRAGVPLYSDPPTARTLHATIKIGETIEHTQYRAVAVAIRYAQRIRSLART